MHVEQAAVAQLKPIVTRFRQKRTEETRASVAAIKIAAS
jgi:hypothetical protein